MSRAHQLEGNSLTGNRLVNRNLAQPALGLMDGAPPRNFYSRQMRDPVAHGEQGHS